MARLLVAAISSAILMVVVAPPTSDPYWLINADDYCSRSNLPVYPGRVPGKTLQSVQVFFRHAARGDLSENRCFGNNQPIEYSCNIRSGFYLDSPIFNGGGDQIGLTKIYQDNHGCQQGQALDVGIVQVERTAKWIHEAYSDVLLSINDLNLVSTDTQRTMATLNLMLSNLFPQTDRLNLFVKTREYKADSLATNSPQCPRLAAIRETWSITPSIQTILKTSEYARCAALWKQTTGTEFSVGDSSECLTSSICANATLPDNLVITPELFGCVMNVSFEQNGIRYGGLKSEYKPFAIEDCKLATAQFLTELQSNIRTRPDQSGLWATHDVTLICLMHLLSGGWDLVWPKFASTIIFEVYDDNSIRMLRDGKVLADVSLHDLVDAKLSTPEGYRDECNNVHVAGAADYNLRQL